jgi:hypothetical protein
VKRGRRTVLKLPSETSVVIATTSIQIARASGTLHTKHAAQPVLEVVGMKLAKSSAKSNS